MVVVVLDHARLSVHRQMVVDVLDHARLSVHRQMVVVVLDHARLSVHRQMVLVVLDHARLSVHRQMVVVVAEEAEKSHLDGALVASHLELFSQFWHLLLTQLQTTQTPYMDHLNSDSESERHTVRCISTHFSAVYYVHIVHTIFVIITSQLFWTKIIRFVLLFNLHLHMHAFQI